MKKKGERKIGGSDKREEILQKAGAYSAVFFMAFFVALVSASTFAPVDKTNAEDLSVNLQSGDYYLQMNSATDITIDMEATRDGSIMIATNTPTLHTNCERAKMYMSFDNTVANINNTGLYLDGNSETANKIVAVSGTSTDPEILSNNSWGWAKSGEPFSEVGYYTTETNWMSAKFAQMPMAMSPVLIYELSGNTSHTEQNVGPTIYYGVKANTALISGTYTPAKTSSTPAKVVYTVVGEGSATTTESIGINPAEGWADGGDTVIISTDIYSSKPDSELLSDFSAKIDGNNCVLTGVSRGTTGALSFQCVTPVATNQESGVDVMLSSDSFGQTWTLADGFVYKPTTFKNPTTSQPIQTMQEMTSAICAEEVTPTSAAATVTISAMMAKSDSTTYVAETVLTDTRDGKTYVVRKLADGNCWMSQNLDLDLSTNVALNTDTSDVSRSWTPENNTQSQSETRTKWLVNGVIDAESVNQARSYDKGEIYCYGTTPGVRQDCTATMTRSRTEHVGNVYNWYAMTAGTGTYEMTSESPDATDSICPKGWMLPTYTTATNTNGNQYSYFNLVSTAYQIASSVGGALKLRLVPLSFLPGGGYNQANGPDNLGAVVQFWTSTAVSAQDAKSLGADTTGINPSRVLSKAHGISVRCVAR